MKQIWVDGYEANVKQRVGSNQVAFELLKNLEKQDKDNCYTILLPQKPLADLPKERENWTYKVLKPKKLWTRTALPLALLSAKQKPDIFFSPSHYLPAFIPKKVKKIMLIHDLAFIYYPDMFEKKDLFKLTRWTKKSAKKADHIISVSESTKKDIIKNYHISPLKISVCYEGYDKNLFRKITDETAIKKVLKKYSIEQNYLLYVGTLQPRKNLVILFEALKDLADIKLVIVGKSQGEGQQGWMYKKILQTPQKLGISDKVIFTGFVPSEDLPYLLNSAKAFVLPSLYEGFGIPVIEAFACGTPVVTSSVSSLPEIVDDSGLLFDPKSQESVKQTLEKLLSNQTLQKKLSQKSLNRARIFSWETMAQQVKDILEKIAE